MKSLISILFILCFISQSFAQPVWNIQNSGTMSNLNDIQLKSSISGQALLVVGDYGVILKSTNSGFIWETVNSNTTSNLYSIAFRNYNDTGYAVGSNGTIIITLDGGNSWANMVSNTSNTLKDLRIVYSSVKAIAVGENGTFLKLEDNVWTASQIDTVDFNSVTSDLFAITQMTIVGNYGSVLKTTNSGINWRILNSGVTNNLNYISENTIVGDNGTALRVNINLVYAINSGTINDLKALYQSSTFIYKSCGSNGTILNNWHSINSITSVNLNSIIQTDIDNCYVVGNNGTILFTNTFNISPNAKQLNSNNISAWFFNNGNFNHHPDGGNGGFEWPKGENKYARYSSGLLIGAIVNSDTLVTVCDYSSEFFPGQTINGTPQGNGTPDFQVYKLIFNVNDSDRLKWLNTVLGNSDQGAPVYFDSTIMNWKPSDYGNQTMFYSYTDSYDASHTNFAGRTAPLKADIKQINFSFNQPEELKNIIYQEYRIINRSNSQWTNAYINLYTDDDLGETQNDAEGIDTNLSLAYTYNYTNMDPVYGTAPPAVGFVIIRAPTFSTGNINDSVYIIMKEKIRKSEKVSSS
ncbi:MAG: YCF48-related protein [Bacteroidota bacterium]|nr:YCF48-related protein [Bacteroidota bacterium]